MELILADQLLEGNKGWNTLITIHKFQGSILEIVIIPILTQHFKILLVWNVVEPVKSPILAFLLAVTC